MGAPFLFGVPQEVVYARITATQEAGTGTPLATPPGLGHYVVAAVSSVETATFTQVHVGSSSFASYVADGVSADKWDWNTVSIHIVRITDKTKNPQMTFGGTTGTILYALMWFPPGKLGIA